MTWQNELQKLDEELASGRISADDYRRRRDEVLAQVSGAPSTPQQGGQGQGGAPFPPPFKWEQAPPEATQVVRPVGQQDDNADRTQVVKNSGGPQQNQNDAERTQVVPNSARAQGPNSGGFPQQAFPQQVPPGQQGWNQQPDSFTPWGGSDMSSGQDPWGIKQGPEVFDKTSSGKGKKIFAVVGVIVLIAAIGGGVWWFTTQNSGNDTPQGGGGTTQSSAAPTTTTKKKPDPFGNLVVPEGQSAGPQTYSAEQLDTTKPLPTPDLVLLKQAGATQARSIVVTDRSTTISLWAFAAPDAAALLEDMTTDQKRFGFNEVPDLTQGDVRAYASEQQNSENKTIYAYRAHYTAGSEVIRVEAFDADDETAREQFTAQLTAQLEHTPAK